MCLQTNACFSMLFQRLSRCFPPVPAFSYLILKIYMSSSSEQEKPTDLKFTLFNTFTPGPPEAAVTARQVLQMPLDLFSSLCKGKHERASCVLAAPGR